METQEFQNTYENVKIYLNKNETIMTKQQFLDKKATCRAEEAAKTIIVTHSKTHLTQLERAIRNLDYALFTTDMKKITLSELYEAITTAKKLVCDTQPEQPTSISTPPKQ